VVTWVLAVYRRTVSCMISLVGASLALLVRSTLVRVRFASLRTTWTSAIVPLSSTVTVRWGLCAGIRVIRVVEVLDLAGEVKVVTEGLNSQSSRLEGRCGSQGLDPPVFCWVRIHEYLIF
jgi:uncharacterized protein YqfA (UPF0365 family)